MAKFSPVNLGKLTSKMGELREDYSYEEREKILNYLSKKMNASNTNAKEREAAAILHGYINAIFSEMYRMNNFGKFYETYPNYYTYLDDFFSATGYANSHTKEGVALTQTFRAVTDLFNYYRGLDVQQNIENFDEAIKKTEDEDAQINNEIETIMRESLEEGFNIDDDAESLVEQIDKEIKVTEKQLKKDKKVVADINFSYHLQRGEPDYLDFIEFDNKQRKRQALFSADVAKVEAEIKQCDEQIAIFDEALNSNAFEAISQLYSQINSYQDEIDNLSNEMKEKAAQANSDVFKDAFYRSQTYGKDYNTYMAHQDYFDQYAMHLSVIADKQRQFSELNVKLQEAINAVSAAKENNASEEEINNLSKAYNDLSNDMQTIQSALVDSTQYIYDLKANNPGLENILQGGDEEILYFAGDKYREDLQSLDSRKELTDEINALEEKQNALKDNIEDIKHNKIPQFKKAFAVKGLDDSEYNPVVMSLDQIKEKLSKAKADMIQKKEGLQTDTGYLKDKEEKEQLEKFNSARDVKKIIAEHREASVKVKANTERLKRLEKIKNSLAQVSTKISANNEAKLKLNQTLQGINTKQVGNDIANQISVFESKIETLSRGNTHYNFDQDDNSPQNKQFISKNSKEFVALRKALHNTNLAFANKDLSLAQKKEMFEALKATADDYMKARKAETRLFQSSTRKFRMSYVQSIADFCKHTLDNFDIAIKQEYERRLEGLKQNQFGEKQTKDYVKNLKTRVLTDYNDKKLAAEKELNPVLMPEKIMEDLLSPEQKEDMVQIIYESDEENNEVIQEDEPNVENVDLEVNPFDNPHSFESMHEAERQNEIERTGKDPDQPEPIVEEKPHISKNELKAELANRIVDILRNKFNISEEDMGKTKIAASKSKKLYLQKDGESKTHYIEDDDFAEYMYYKCMLYTLEQKPNMSGKELDNVLKKDVISSFKFDIVRNPDFKEVKNNCYTCERTFDFVEEKLVDPLYRKFNDLELSFESCRNVLYDRFDRYVPKFADFYIGEKDPNKDPDVKNVSEHDFQRFLVANLTLNLAKTKKISVGELNRLINNEDFENIQINTLKKTDAYKAMKNTFLHKDSMTRAELLDLTYAFIEGYSNKTQEKEVVNEAPKQPQMNVLH